MTFLKAVNPQGRSYKLWPGQLPMAIPHQETLDKLEAL